MANDFTSFPAVVGEDLSLNPINPARLKQHLLPLKGQTVNLIIKKLTTRRSDPQNRYYWGVVVKMIADNCGYRSAEEIEGVHAELKRRFLPTFGRLKVAKSTSRLDAKEFGEYLEAVRQFAAEELNLYIPDPNETEY